VTRGAVVAMLVVIWGCGMVGCGKRSVVRGEGPGPLVVPGEAGGFVVAYPGVDDVWRGHRLDRTGRFLEREIVLESIPEVERAETDLWQCLVRPLGDDRARLAWRAPSGETWEIGVTPLIDGEAAIAPLVRAENLLFLVWIETAPTVSRLMVSAVDVESGAVFGDILRDGVPADGRPGFAVVDRQMFLAFVRRGRLRTGLIRLPGNWFEPATVL